ncbi:hypothetical protein PFNF135_04705 [Plasmodium falciparum NF135/5.C10]|uniref:Inner centromere protein ARK-binding domain-containing protein n=2 Tax=Plasmodium falciparum TaxID=5833 RepID=A0A0L7M8D6_PLAF4|nr:hypothetical protein PFNF135_04705 [Plasmodium falciparum NF135/5.C10]KOB88830.1 hypothetical protein PFDG_03705 [Plasmodium falciparum Dd2]
MIVLTENPLEKTNNCTYSSNKVLIKRKSNTQLKVIANRITPYFKGIIRTRRFLKLVDKTGHKYLYSKNNINNNIEKEKKIKNRSDDIKKKNLNKLDKIFKIKQNKQNKVITNRVHFYNSTLKDSYITNLQHQENSELVVHVKDKKKRISNNKKKCKKDLFNIREITLDNLKDINTTRYFHDLHKLNNKNLQSKVKKNICNNIYDIYNNHINNKKHSAQNYYALYDTNNKNVNNIHYVDSITNSQSLKLYPLINNNAYVNIKRDVSKKSSFHIYNKRTLTSNSLIDSIISLSNELNKSTVEKKIFNPDYEYDKNVLHYVNKILNDSKFNYDITPSNGNKNDIEKLKFKIKKYNNIPIFYFRKLFKYIIEQNNNNNNNNRNNSSSSYRHTNQSNIYDVFYDSDGNITYNDPFYTNRNHNDSCKYIHDDNKDISFNSFVYTNYYSDNYFSDRTKVKKNNKRNLFHQNFRSFIPINSIKSQGNHNIDQDKRNNQKRNLKSGLKNKTIGLFHSKEVGSFKKKNEYIINSDNIVNNNVSFHKDKHDPALNSKINNSCYHPNNYHHIKRISINSNINMYQKEKNINNTCIPKNRINEICIKKNFNNNYKNIHWDNSKYNHINNTSQNIKTRSSIFVDSNNFSTPKEIVTNKKLKDISHPNKEVILKSRKEEIYKYIRNIKNEIDKNDVLNSKYNELMDGLYNPNNPENLRDSNDKSVVSILVNYPSSSIRNSVSFEGDVNENYHNNNNNNFYGNNNYNNASNSSSNSSRSNSSCKHNNIYNNNHNKHMCIKNNVKECNDNVRNNIQNENSKYNSFISIDANCSFNSNNIKRNDSYINISEDDNYNNSVINENNNNNNNYDNYIDFISLQKNDNRENQSYTSDLKEQRKVHKDNITEKLEQRPSGFVINNINELKSLTSSIHSIYSSAELIKTPIESNIENNHLKNNREIFPSKDIKSLCIFKQRNKKVRSSNNSSFLIDFRNSHTNNINMLTENQKFNNVLLNKEIQMDENQEREFSIDDCLMNCLKHNASNLKTNEDYERYCNEDKILNPDYKPSESRKLGEKFLQKSQKELYYSYANNGFHCDTNLNNAEVGNSCFKNDNGYSSYNDPNMNYLHNMKINVFNNNRDFMNNNNLNSIYNNNHSVSSIYKNNYINSIHNEYYMKGNNEYITNDKFIKYYEKYSNKDVDENEAKKLNYTDCYDFKNSLLNGLSRDDSFCSDDDLKNDENDMNFLKDSINSFDNLESTEKKYEEILRDFNGKIPLLHKVLKPLPAKNRSNNFDICLYLLQKHGGDLNNEENICILRDKEIVEHSAIYDTKKCCIKSNITNVTNIKLYHPKWYNKKKIIERLKEQSCYNPFTIFGSAPSLLDFDEVFDKDVYNKFVSRNSRKNHSLLRVLAKQKVINNLNDKITDKEWPQVHAYLKKRWSKETNIELNWACDPLLYEELEWYLSTNNEYLNMTDKVADIEVCYCPTLDPNSYYAWNDSRVIYTNLCYNKSKDEVDANNNSVNKGRYMMNKNMELKNNDKQVSFRKRASGCEHLMFQQNIMKQKNLSKRKKKLLKKKKKMLKEKNKLLNNNNNDSGNNKGDTEIDANAYFETSENYENNSKNMYPQNNNNNNNNYSSNDNNPYYPNIFITKRKKSVYYKKNNDDDTIPIMTVNTSLYRNNMDNRYNCNNTAYDYIKNKDHTIKFFASPKKTKKNNSYKKSVNNSNSFYLLNSSMINNDNMYNNNFNSFDSKKSMDCNDPSSSSIYNKNMFIEKDNIKNKNEIDARNYSGRHKFTSDINNEENVGANIEVHENIFKKNIYETNNNKYTYDVNKNYYKMNFITQDDNNDEDNNNNSYTDDNSSISGIHLKNKNDGMKSFAHMNQNQNNYEYNMKNKYINNNNYYNSDNNVVNMSIYKDIRMDEKYKNNNNNYRNDDSESNHNCYNNYKGYNNDTKKERFNTNNFVDNYYQFNQIKVEESDEFNNFRNMDKEYTYESDNKSIFKNKLSTFTFSEEDESKKKYNINELKEKYVNIYKEQNINDNYTTNVFENAFDKNANNNNKYFTSKTMGIEYFQNKQLENMPQMGNKKIIENVTSINLEKNNVPIKKTANVFPPEEDIFKLTHKNIDTKNIVEQKVKSNNTSSIYSNKKNETDNSLNTFNSKRLSNSNISVNENRKIRRYTNKMCEENDNISFEASENIKEQSNKKGSIETSSSRTSDTSMSSAFKMATSVFKKLF